ncbi:MAG TPA: tetratricopeptide repeat protein, partial [Planctomycetota bacterium]|nr:tetratricopeptide repeat protein [Planctomycetota bacterium]
LAQSNGNRHLRLIWGVLLEMRGQKESARRWWYETLQRYPDYVELREKLCNLENDLGHYAEAAQLAERGVEAAPSQLNLKYSLGRALYGLGRKQEALTQFDGILDLDPGYFLAGYSKGLVLLELGQRDAARKAWLSAQEHIDMANPDVAESLRQGLKSLGP